MTKSQKAALNKLLREYVSLRDGESCLRCKKTERLQISHVYPRGRYKRMTFEPDNIKLLCYACHLTWWHKAPVEAHEWLQTVLTPQRLNRLKLMSNDNSPNRLDYKLHKLWLEKTISRLAATR